MQFEVPDLEYDIIVRDKNWSDRKDPDLGNSSVRYTKRIESDFSTRLNVFDERERSDHWSSQNKVNTS